MLCPVFSGENLLKKATKKFAAQLTVFGFWEYHITLPQFNPREVVVMLPISAQFEKTPFEK